MSWHPFFGGKKNCFVFSQIQVLIQSSTYIPRNNQIIRLIPEGSNPERVSRGPTRIRKARRGRNLARIRLSQPIHRFNPERIIRPAGQVKRQIALSPGYFIRRVGLKLSN